MSNNNNPEHGHGSNSSSPSPSSSFFSLSAYSRFLSQGLNPTMMSNNNPQHGSNSSKPASSSSLFLNLSSYNRFRRCRSLRTSFSSSDSIALSPTSSIDSIPEFYSHDLNPTMMSRNNPQYGYGSNSSKPSSSSSSSSQSLSSYGRFRLSRSQRIPSSSSSDSIPYSLKAISSAVENSLSSIQLGLCSIKRCTLGNQKVSIFSLHIGSHRKSDMSPSHLSTLPSRSHHPSLVKLLGASQSRDGGRMYMVYEDIPGATLKDCLQTSSNSNLLSNWTWRMQVALDLARGLEHIHHHCGMVHNMIMSSTVVITEANSNACISLFGADKFRKRGIEGPVGFAAPEVLKDDGKISQKSDVYAFGVVILELISGQVAARKWEENEGVLLVETARETIGREHEPEHEIRRGRRVMQFVDRRLHNSFPMETAEGLIKVALKCVEDAPDLRPKMASVAEDIQRLFLDFKGYQWAVSAQRPIRARPSETLAEPSLRPDSPRPV